MPVHTWDKKSGNARRARRCILLAGCQTTVSSAEVVVVIPTLCLSLPSVEAVAMIPTPRPSLQCWGVSLSVVVEVHPAASVSKHFINIVLGGCRGWSCGVRLVKQGRVEMVKGKVICCDTHRSRSSAILGIFQLDCPVRIPDFLSHGWTPLKYIRVHF